jgi:hypothetical protein
MIAPTMSPPCRSRYARATSSGTPVCQMHTHSNLSSSKISQEAKAHTVAQAHLCNYGSHALREPGLLSPPPGRHTQPPSHGGRIVKRGLQRRK